MGGLYKIGSLQPLTGTAATAARTALIGTELAVRRINASGGINGRPVELVVVRAVTPRRTKKKTPFEEVRDVERLVGTRKLRALPLHVWCRELIAAGRASPELLAAAERSRLEWDAFQGQR